MTENDILDAIRQYGKERPKRPVGKHWRTIAEMAKREAVGISTMRWRMKVALTNGLKVERFVGSDYDAMGTLCKQTWFRVKP